MREPVPGSFILYEKHALAEVYYNLDLKIALVITTANFVPIQDFKTIFSKVKELAELHSLRKVVFDKRSLTVFHQPSMEWYYLEWKSEMLQDQGIKEHGKILPKDDPFRQSVEQARKRIFRDNPTHSIHGLNIIYFENFQEALEKQ